MYPVRALRPSTQEHADTQKGLTHMERSVIVKARKISNVAGNITYLKNTKEHPETCLVQSSCDIQLWLDYAKVNQEAFRRSNQKGECKCVEARELIFVCPEEFYKIPLQQRDVFLDQFVQGVQKRLGTEVYVALHAADKDASNMHFHVMYMERKKVLKNEKVATRRLYFDPEGRQVKSKKYAIDENGQLLPGYSFVKTGEVYGEVEWTAKNKNLRSNEFTQSMKQWWADQINHLREKDRPWTEGVEERVVYDRNTSPFLSEQSYKTPFKYHDAEKQAAADEVFEAVKEDILECNALRKEYNAHVQHALSMGASRQELVERRKRVTANIEAAVKEGRSYQIKEILQSAVIWIRSLIDRIKLRKPSIDDLIGGGKQRVSEAESGLKKQNRAPKEHER